MRLETSVDRGGPIVVRAFATANSRAYLSAIFAAYRNGAVVLALPRNVSQDIPGIEISEQQYFEDDPGWFSETLEPIHSDDPAQISFSSGTTGRPKAILLSHRALSDVVERINAVMGIDSTIREYVGVPVTFSFGFGRVRAVAAAGGQSYLPPRGFDPSEIRKMLEAGEINAISAVPTLWRVVLENPQAIGPAGEKVRWIEIGSQYMSGDEKATLRQIFPNARIVQHYGLTEASRTTLLDITASDEAHLETVGRAEGSVEIKLSAADEIRIRGPHLALGLVTEDGVHPITDSDGWLTTADRGRIEDGWLYYEGRSDELINVGGIKIDPTRFEQRLCTDLGASDGVAIGRLPDPLRGDRILVALQKDAGLDSATVASTAQKIAADFGLVGSGAIAVRTIANIPKTATGKVRRKDLSDQPELDAKPQAVRVATSFVPDAGEAELRASEMQKIWASALGMASVPVHENFYDLGGDSLSALTVILGMEAKGIDAETARGIFDGKTIAELAGLPKEITPASPPVKSETDDVAALTLSEAMGAIHATRGLLALWVVTVHWLPGVLARLPGEPTWLYSMLSPALRFGTPGFALVFGFGIGALGIPQYQRNPEQFRASNWVKFRLVLGGVLLMALFSAGVRWTTGGFDDANWPSYLFYSAISFYALALLTLPWTLRLLTVWPHVLITTLALMIATMSIHELLYATFAWRQPEGFVELLKILMTAKYGFFRMMECRLGTSFERTTNGLISYAVWYLQALLWWRAVHSLP